MSKKTFLLLMASLISVNIKTSIASNYTSPCQTTLQKMIKKEISKELRTKIERDDNFKRLWSSSNYSTMIESLDQLISNFPNHQGFKNLLKILSIMQNHKGRQS